jgi:hypothetical protein
MRKTFILFAFAGALLLGNKTMAQTLTSLTLGWNPSSSAGVAGYDIYYGTSSNNWTSAVPVAGQGATSVTIRGLVSGQTYYFAAAAFDSNGDQSSLSPAFSATAGVIAPAIGLLSAVAGLPTGQFGFAFSGASSAQYIVQASTDLVHWVAVQTNTGSFKFVDSNASQFTHRFYRTVSTSN